MDARREGVCGAAKPRSFTPIPAVERSTRKGVRGPPVGLVRQSQGTLGFARVAPKPRSRSETKILLRNQAPKPRICDVHVHVYTWVFSRIRSAAVKGDARHERNQEAVTPGALDNLHLRCVVYHSLRV